MPAVYYIPTGPANLASLFPAINWNDVDEYYVEVGSLATTPHYKITGCNEDVTIHFVNYLGCIDSVTFEKTIEHDTKSDTYQRPSQYPLEKSQPGITRFSIKSNDTYTLVAVFPEEHMNWLAELFDAPLAWMQLKGAQGQADDYIPLVISDQSFVKLKDAERYGYEVTVKATLSHERVIISN